MEKIRVGVVGATGYAGSEICRLIAGHPQAELAAISSVSFEGMALSQVYPAYNQMIDLVCGTQDQVVEAAIRGAEQGMKEYPRIRVGLILCCMRGDTNQELNMQTVETAKKYLGSVVCAVDIAGAEGLFPTEMFAPVFAKVREYGLPMTIHAGEAAGPDSMRTALSYGTKRIGHGVAAIEDPELVKRLVEEGITLEVSVTSNYHTKVVDRLEDHPIHRLFDAGVRVTINSDNMTCSRTNVNKELDLMRTVFGFTEEEIEKMEEYAWEARFLKN